MADAQNRFTRPAIPTAEIVPPVILKRTGDTEIPVFGWNRARRHRWTRGQAVADGRICQAAKHGPLGGLQQGHTSKPIGDCYVME